MTILGKDRWKLSGEKMQLRLTQLQERGHVCKCSSLETYVAIKQPHVTWLATRNDYDMTWDWPGCKKCKHVQKVCTLTTVTCLPCVPGLVPNVLEAQAPAEPSSGMKGRVGKGSSWPVCYEKGRSLKHTRGCVPLIFDIQEWKWTLCPIFLKHLLSPL